MQEYNLDTIAKIGYTYAQIQDRILRLLYAGVIAHKVFKIHLELKGYRESTYTPRL